MPASAASHVATLSPSALAHAIEEYFAAHPGAVLLEDGRVLFDLRLAQFSVSAERGRCLLHLWSDERNIVRTITAMQPRRDSLRLETRRFGQTKPQILTLIPDPDFRTPTARDASRRRYQRALVQVLASHFPGWTPDSFRSAADLEHSFGPAYARGILSRGQSAWAVLGVGPDEPSATVDGALTLGILWLAYCREHGGARRLFHGLRLVLPRGCATVSRSRMPWLDRKHSQWELYELDLAETELRACDIGDDGNVAVQLTHAFNPQSVLDRSATAIASLQALLPAGLMDQTEIRPRTATEISFSLHGLEYARIRHGVSTESFSRCDAITFGAGPNATALDDVTEDIFRDLADRLFLSRRPDATARDALYRLQPERWLESVLRRDLGILDPLLGRGPVYSQVPAFASSSRTLLDLLTVNRQGRLVVLEIKTDDDLHLPLQALDYWIRVRTLNRSCDLTRHGYFPGIELSQDDPLLCLIAPSLHMHPANEAVLRHLAVTVPWEFIGLDERWRENCRVILRKRSAPPPPSHSDRR